MAQSLFIGWQKKPSGLGLVTTCLPALPTTSMPWRASCAAFPRSWNGLGSTKANGAGSASRPGQRRP